MAYYEPQGWQAPVRQASWEQPPAPPSRSGTSSTAPRDEHAAFSAQFDEVERAIDNLVKSGKLFNSIPRRDSVPMMMGRHYPDFDPRMGGMSRHSISDYESVRPLSASNIQGFYAAQRYQGRPNETEQMMQAKRRMAAQRERELRNYHQEQQYNRSVLAEMSGNKSERSMSPAATMTEESRRELIARQHRALYGNESPAFFPNGGLSEEHAARPTDQPAGTPTTAPGGARGPSPRNVDPFGLGQNPASGNADPTGQAVSGAGVGPSPVVPQSQSPSNSTSSPSAGVKPTSYNVFESNPAQQQPHTSTSSPNSESAGRPPVSKPGTNPTVGPIGSRPAQQVGGPLNKASLPSPLGYGFAPNEMASSVAGGSNAPGNERSASSASNPSASTGAGTVPTTGVMDPNSVAMGWGNKSGVWRSKNSLGVQASVWG